MWGSQVTGSIAIDRPVEEVFDLVADERHEPLYNRDMTSSEKLTDGPIGGGTRFGIEEKVLALQERKRELFARVVDDGGLMTAPLSAEDIRGLLGA